jgi:hypothetical protein
MATEVELDDDGNPIEDKPKPAKKKKLELDPEQTEGVKDLVNKTFGAGFDKAEAIKNKEIEALNAQLAELKAKLEAPKKEDAPPPPPPPPPPAPKDDPVAKLNAEMEELRNVVKQALGAKGEAEAKLETFSKVAVEAEKKDAFLRSLGTVQFFEPMDVFDDIKDQLGKDEEHNSTIVLNPKTKTARLGIDMQPIPLSEFIAEYAAKKPWLVKGDSAEGTGSGPSLRTPKTGGDEDWSQMSPEKFEEAKQRIRSR